MNAKILGLEKPLIGAGFGENETRLQAKISLRLKMATMSPVTHSDFTCRI